MQFQTLALRQPKLDCPDLEHCEDFLAFDDRKGLFAVSDGAGSTICADLWSRCLVEQYLQEPLTDNDGFEVEYWVHRAQERFEPLLPPTAERPWFTEQKYREGSAATFVGAQFRPSEKVEVTGSGGRPGREVASCTVVAAGDSCALHYRNGILLASFPWETAADFVQLPTCFPTLGYVAQWWKSVVRRDLELNQGDFLVLATDAVSKWLLVASDELRRERFKMLSCQTQASWPHFIAVLRRANVIPDDDSTAIIVRLCQASGALEDAERQAADNRKDRWQRLNTALRNNDLVRVALEYGSGAHFPTARLKTRSGEKVLMADSEILQNARKTVDGRRRLMEATGRAFNSGSADNREIQALWDEYRNVLRDLPLAEKIRATLQVRGVLLDPVAVEAGPLEAVAEIAKEPAAQIEDPAGGQAATAPDAPQADQNCPPATDRVMGLPAADQGDDTFASCSLGQPGPPAQVSVLGPSKADGGDIVTPEEVLPGGMMASVGAASQDGSAAAETPEPVDVQGQCGRGTAESVPTERSGTEPKETGLLDAGRRLLRRVFHE